MIIPTGPALQIQKARSTLLLDHPFFGSLLFRLTSRESYATKTMATDGISLYYNPAFVESLNAVTLCGVLAHEVFHPALHHHLRRGNRDPRRWNMACDYAINPVLLDAGFSLPAGVLVSDRFQGMSAEQIYNLLESESDSENREDRQTENAGTTGTSATQGEAESQSIPETEGGVGQVLDAPEGAESGASEAEQARAWNIAVHQATTLAQQAGKLPAGLDRTLEAKDQAAVDWREFLRRAWSDTTPSDYSWMRPNRRYIWTGIYLPGIIREGAGEVAIAVDCSGSISPRQLGLFEAEVRSILMGQRPARVYVLYFDAAVHNVETYAAGEAISLSPVGGGGTEFGPCFEWLLTHGIVPQTMVFLTDLYGTFPEQPPAFPVLWASTGGRTAPFGEVIPMQAA